MENLVYLNKINDQIQSLYSESTSANRESFNIGFDISYSFRKWQELIPEKYYNNLIDNAIESIEVSMVSLAYCIYRNAFSSLRLSMEMLFGALYYSAHKIEYIEWSKNYRDINWATVNCFENGVLSVRFAQAFFPDLADISKNVHTKAKEAYRNLSEHVHGNFHTWEINNAGLKINSNLNSEYLTAIMGFREIVAFAFSLRFLSEIPQHKLEEIEPLIQTVMHYEPIVNFFKRTI